MDLFEQINEDIKTAMKAKDADKLNALRGIKAELLIVKTSGQGNEISNETAIALLQKMVKQRKDAADIYKQQNREDLYEKEMKEVFFIMPYLPKQLSENELIEEVKKIIAEIGASSIKDMGKTMNAANTKLQGKAESKNIAKVVKDLLTL